MAEKCPYCNTKVKSLEQQVNCPSCGTLYHYGCWKYFTEKCTVCGLENEDYKIAKQKAKERKEEKEKQQEINTTNANQQNPEEDTKKQETQVCFGKGGYYVQENTNVKIKNEETGMFINVSGKIKGLAKAITIIGIIFGIIVSIAAMFAYGDHMILASVAMGVGVALSAWTTSLLLYAFGELVANSKESKELQQQILDELRSKDHNKE